MAVAEVGSLGSSFSGVVNVVQVERGLRWQEELVSAQTALAAMTADLKPAYDV
jgi:hypothetical protein